MKAVVQRVTKAKLFCEGKLISEIDKGLVVYFGVQQGDDNLNASYLAKKISNLRVFEDENKKMNLSVKDVSGSVLAVSQFTLIADVKHGNRPSFSYAEEPIKANEIYEFFISELQKENLPVKKGVFGGDMKIEQYNDGPVTIIYEI